MNTSVFVSALHDLNEQFIKLVEFLSALQELACISVCHTNMEQLLHQALTILMRYQFPERCSVFIVKDGVLENAASRDLDEAMEPAGARAAKAVFVMGEGVIGLAAKTGELQHCRNCMTDVRFKFFSGIEFADCEGSIIAVPIFVENRIFGVLNVYHPHPYRFNEEHERLLTLFSKVLGQLIASNRYVHDMEHLIRGRTRELERALEDAREWKRHYEELCITDELTGLHNRRFFFPEGEAALARAIRYQQPLSVLIADLDQFKLINDVFGHAMGDRALQDVARVLQEETRAGDTLVRFGGEEFAFVLPSTDLTGARQLADRLRDRVTQLGWEVHGRSVSVSMSIGITSLREDSKDSRDTRALLDTLLSEAGKALYLCKGQGGNGVLAYQDLISLEEAR
jgi:diguanylate cyclase (GGDEF)-like protein